MRKCLFIAIFCLLSCQTLLAANIGLMIVATGKYIQFISPLLESARKHFCPNHTITYFVFTDGYLTPQENMICFYYPKLGWPFDTMMRYTAYLAHSDILLKQDYLFATDADMFFVDRVGDEILGERVATLHPGFAPGSKYPRSRGAYETNPVSKAHVQDSEGKHYFAGGFYGGTAEEMLRIAEINTIHIYQDLRKNVVAVWHDESHWNRYCIDHPPTVILSPSYCYPENWDMPYPKKLLALDKNHGEIR